MTSTPSAHQGFPRPGPIRALPTAAVVRMLVGAAATIGGAIALARSWDDSQTRLDRRTGGAAFPGFAHLGDAIASVSALYGVLYLLAWLFAVRGALRGTRWAAVCTGALSAYGVVTGLLSLALLGFQSLLPVDDVLRLPTWYFVLAVAFAAADVVVLALLLLPESRAWFRVMNPVRPVPSPWPAASHGPGYGPPWYGPPVPGRRH